MPMTAWNGGDVASDDLPPRLRDAFPETAAILEDTGRQFQLSGQQVAAVMAILRRGFQEDRVAAPAWLQVG